MQLKYDANGLITAVVQDELSGDVRMVAWMNAEALAATLRTGRATFFSRSRQALWTKGETSGNVLWVRSVHVDCDGDTLLVRARADGPSCHTGRLTCFFQEMRDGRIVESGVPPATFLDALEAEITERQQSSAEKSYTRHLLDGGAERVGGKLREEAAELAQALDTESDERVASEAADVLYHLLVGLRLRGVRWSQVIEVLQARSGTSGHEEKARRARQ